MELVLLGIDLGNTIALEQLNYLNGQHKKNGFHASFDIFITLKMLMNT